MKFFHFPLKVGSMLGIKDLLKGKALVYLKNIF